MKNSLRQFVYIILLLNSCKNNDTIVQLHEYNERAAGSFIIGKVNAFVIENQLGPIIIEGNSDTSVVNWFLNKSTSAKSNMDANKVFSEINANLTVKIDTAYIKVTGSESALLSLTLPNKIPCILRNVKGTSNVSYLFSDLIGENVNSITVVSHQGNLIVNNAKGNSSVEIVIPDSGKCVVNLLEGDIALKVPTSTSSVFFAETKSGAFTLSNLQLSDSVRTTHSLTGKLGNGGSQIYLKTEKGDITVIGF